ncbi:TrmB family transcriptional regulator sugar-binding domain-containing protein [Methanocella arvoryzae]|uniref:Uncharacterized protein n=1 Tax=Methanocella arvoryzae (strain DSM 22066 / NBRC 105507 / MRE50) TaxID=351160 RepID=Q0W2N7_METAR|nr:TrmB family transcriptional regulator sugar-binding domain-containing protein [Methanocella arvoryzae]CAJ37356.1 hypothetical protein RCIX2239 [Methanocella arvoryzae MRE50]
MKTLHSEDAIVQLEALESEFVAEAPQETLWSIYGAPSIEAKLEDMLDTAKKSVLCMAPEQYLDSLRRIAGKGLELSLVIITENKTIKRELEECFHGDNVRVRTLTPAQVASMYTTAKMSNRVSSMPEYREAIAGFDFFNNLILVVDHSEFLYVPPLPGKVYSALHTTSKPLIIGTSLIFGGLQIADLPE